MAQAKEKTIFKRPEAMKDAITHYCPGCTHGVIHRLVAETIDELGIRRRTVGVAPVGCAVLAYNYFNCDFQEAAHGRAPAMATGWAAMRFGWAAYVIPVLFAFSPTLNLIGDPGAVAFAALTAMEDHPSTDRRPMIVMGEANIG